MDSAMVSNERKRSTGTLIIIYTARVLGPIGLGIVSYLLSTSLVSEVAAMALLSFMDLADPVHAILKVHVISTIIVLLATGAIGKYLLDYGQWSYVVLLVAGVAVGACNLFDKFYLYNISKVIQ